MSAQAWVTLVAAVLGFGGVIASLAQANRTLRQRANADDRGEAFKRITYCLDKMLSDRQKDAAVGMDVLTVVAESSFITNSERDILIVVADRFSGEVATETGTEDTEGEEA